MNFIQAAILAPNTLRQLSPNPHGNILRARLRDYVVDVGVVKPGNYLVLHNLLQLYEVYDHPLRVRLSLKNYTELVGMSVQFFALPVIVDEVMCSVKLEIFAD